VAIAPNSAFGSAVSFVVALGLAAGPLLGLTSCSDDDHGPTTVEPDEVYVSVIRWELERRHEDAGGSTPTTISDELPIVYVAAADGSDIAANVQARVAEAIVDEATVRFADSRDEALDLDVDNEPVRDDGVLLSIAPVEPDPAQRRTTEVVVYRSLDDHQTWLLTVDAADDGGTITGSTLQPS
jgi:hypothetical protein